MLPWVDLLGSLIRPGGLVGRNGKPRPAPVPAGVTYITPNQRGDKLASESLERGFSRRVVAVPSLDSVVRASFADSNPTTNGWPGTRGSPTQRGPNEGKG